MSHPDARAFFATRAAGWEDRFPDDGPRYERAVHDLAPRVGGVAVDVGCGTGRALVPLREAVGPQGVVIGLDATSEMLAEARARGRDRLAHLVLADARCLPLPDGSVDGIFAAGLVHHLPDPAAGLRELARVAASEGRLAIFHPISRAALAARHGHELRGDEPLSPGRVGDLLAGAGWALLDLDDGPERYLALAERR
ncbi:MAG: class I SAM-dependent methyltransferase [Jatrophihabitans sp.]|uniref:class I SAM-dependent methyltransferase n=1 Tax=Jatrophihabitans sp. TaxID=1932789 RepID=UPI003F816221